MLRTPEPKDQARLLVKLLADANLELGHQASLHIVARLHGHRNWNALEAAARQAERKEVGQAPPSGASAPALSPEGWEQLLPAIEAVVSSADDAGCSDDLTVTSASAVEQLSAMLTSLRRNGRIAPRSQHGFSVNDVQSIRPDLSDEQAKEVLQMADDRFDASVGVNWDVLRAHAACFPVHVAPGILVNKGTRQQLRPVVVDYSTGAVYLGTLDEVRDRESKPGLLHGPSLGLAQDDMAVLIGDHTLVDVGASGWVFDGDNEAMHDSIEDLREQERLYGTKHIFDIQP
jgi:hypothetical protein